MVQGGGGIQDIWVAFTAGSAANLLCDFQQVIFFFFLTLLSYFLQGGESSPSFTWCFGQGEGFPW